MRGRGFKRLMSDQRAEVLAKRNSRLSPSDARHELEAKVPRFPKPLHHRPYDHFHVRRNQLPVNSWSIQPRSREGLLNRPISSRSASQNGVIRAEKCRSPASAQEASGLPSHRRPEPWHQSKSRPPPALEHVLDLPAKRARRLDVLDQLCASIDRMSPLADGYGGALLDGKASICAPLRL